MSDEVSAQLNKSSESFEASSIQEKTNDLDLVESIEEGMPDEELLYDLADLFKTFGDTTRIKILYALMEHELCVADLAEAIDATQSAVSHQLRTLKQSRLVRAKRDGKNVMYSLSDNHVHSMLAQGMTHICE